ncbi:MAG: alpha/beta hydrolase [Lachnospiraceae bacterium]|nr:alpha/beta hydrolase [Lachnospiraceae bacterium]
MRAILHALSYSDMELEASRRLADLKKLDPIRIFCRKLDAEVYNGEYKVPLRLYFPSEKAVPGESALLFFHGGGWVTESVETYDRVCAQMAISTGCMVISVEYRLAPEHHFPVGLLDCYAAARALYLGEFLENVDPKQITVIGDSAGGNLTAAMSMMARDRGEFAVERQILIYPALNNCYTQESAFASVQENGEGYLLTAKKMERYLNLYEDTPVDRQNPYFAPILAADLRNLPRTLILTAEYDPLRDEGEAYGERLREAGNQVEMHRISDALHGFFALGIKFLHVQESFTYINEFLEGQAET